jgi:hypothetical protein
MGQALDMDAPGKGVTLDKAILFNRDNLKEISSLFQFFQPQLLSELEGKQPGKTGGSDFRTSQKGFNGNFY